MGIEDGGDIYAGMTYAENHLIRNCCSDSIRNCKMKVWDIRNLHYVLSKKCIKCIPIIKSVIGQGSFHCELLV